MGGTTTLGGAGVLASSATNSVRDILPLGLKGSGEMMKGEGLTGAEGVIAGAVAFLAGVLSDSAVGLLAGVLGGSAAYFPGAGVLGMGSLIGACDVVEVDAALSEGYKASLGGGGGAVEVCAGSALWL